jgi:hypothetical protein
MTIGHPDRWSGISERPAAPGGERRTGHQEWARRNGKLGDIHSLDDRYDHDVDD